MTSLARARRHCVEPDQLAALRRGGYDAMTTDRPYRAARSADQACAILADERARG